MSVSRWTPLYGTLRVGEWEIRVWSEPVLPGELTWDPWLVRVVGDKLRLVVCDPAHTNPSISSNEVGRKAGRVVGEFAAEQSLDEAARAGVRELAFPLSKTFDNVIVALVALELDLVTGRVEAVGAGDCELWQGPKWERAHGGEMITPEARERFAKHPGAESDDAGLHFKAHVDELSDLSSWIHPPLGLSASLRAEAYKLEGTEFILSSDGAKLSAERCSSVEEWLREGLQTGDKGRYRSPHGDVTVLHVRLASK